MKYLFFFLAFFCSDASCTILLTSITQDLSHKKGLWINITIKNANSNKANCINVETIGFEGVLGNPVFIVKFKGKRINYIGPFASKDPNEQGRIINLLPNQSVTSTVNIQDNYNFKKRGIYEIQYNFKSAHICDDEIYVYELKSDTITIKI